MKFLLLLALALTSITKIGQAQNAIKRCENGDNYFQQYQFERALASYNECYSNDKGNIHYLLKAGQCNYQLGRLMEASKYYEKAFSLDSANLLALNHLGLIYSKQSHISKAVEQYSRLILLDSLNSYYYKQIASLSLQKGNVSEALYYYETAHTINPFDLDIIAALSGIYPKLQLYTKAQQLISKGLDLDSSNVRLLLEGASISYRQREYSQVLDYIERIQSYQQDTSAKAMQLLGVSLYHVHRINEAIAVLVRAAELMPDSEIIHYYLGLAYREKGNHLLSVQHLELAIENGISDNVSIYYTDLAGVWEKQQNYSESIRAYKAAYESSKNKMLLYQLARNYDLFYKDKTTALLYYQKYLAMNDTGNRDLMNYSAHRIDELQEVIHFEID